MRIEPLQSTVHLFIYLFILAHGEKHVLICDLSTKAWASSHSLFMLYSVLFVGILMIVLITAYCMQLRTLCIYLFVYLFSEKAFE